MSITKQFFKEWINNANNPIPTKEWLEKWIENESK